MTISTDIAGAPPSALKDIGLDEQITAIDSISGNRFYPVGKLKAHISKHTSRGSIHLYI